MAVVVRQCESCDGRSSHVRAFAYIYHHEVATGGPRKVLISQGMQVWSAIHCMSTLAPECTQLIANTRPSHSFHISKP